MDDQLTISTPEQVVFHYEVAGIGSRFVASMLDHLILGAVLLLVSWGAGMLFGAAEAAGADAGALNIVLALVVLVYFLVFWGYFLLFELVWNGQTPGKRSGNLRVIRKDGQPIRASEAVVRNLVRLVDILPGFYGVGLIAMFVDKDARRLGDFAAGTIVIREPVVTRLHDVRVQRSVPQGQTAYSAYSASGATPASHQLAAVPPVYDPLPGVSLRDITPEDYRLAREVVERARRGELSRDRAHQLANRLAEGLAGRMGHNFRDWQARGWDPVVFLEAVLIARDARS